MEMVLDRSTVEILGGVWSVVLGVGIQTKLGSVKKVVRESLCKVRGFLQEMIHLKAKPL